jgi:uncharacterized damage-inducible protein DinB
MLRNFPLQRWTERQFQFGYTTTSIPSLTERLSSTAPRIEELVAFCEEPQLAYKPGGKWSVKEHIGHLTDLETLHAGRLDDFENGLKILRAADMTNQKTEEADHNARDLAALCTAFRLARIAFFEKLDALEQSVFEHRALHPRLNQMVNIADILYFVAEHDNHHLTIISRQLSAG